MPVHVCSSCAGILSTLIGLKEASVAEGTTCGACLGAVQRLDDHCRAVARTIAELPFLDCPQVALVPSVPRVISYTIAAAAASLASVAGVDLQGAVPLELMSAVKDTCTARLLRTLGETKCNGRVLELGRVDGNNTIIVEADVNIVFQPTGSEVALVALHAKRTTADQTLEAVRDSGSPLALAMSKLSAELQSNKGAATVSWEFIRVEILPFVDSARHSVDFRVSAWRTPAFLFGFYRKMLRDVSQSPWFVDGNRIGRMSLQEVIATPALKHFFPGFDGEKKAHRAEAGAGVAPKGRPKEFTDSQVVGASLYKFHSAGREDVDVRMLGSGRPFVVELDGPHRTELTATDFAALQSEINSSEEAEVEGLRVFHSRDIMPLLHSMSEEKRKLYRCICYSSRAIRSQEDALLAKLNKTKDLVVQQKTPVRVLHRRSMLTRPKTIHRISASRINDHWLVVDLETQAGAYVKEFCHGDMGRTTPSLGELLESVTDIIQLDVVGVEIVGAAEDSLAALR